MVPECWLKRGPKCAPSTFLPTLTLVLTYYDGFALVVLEM